MRSRYGFAFFWIITAFAGYNCCASYKSLRLVAIDSKAYLGEYYVSGGKYMRKKEEPKPNSWELMDPKPPVIQSGHMEDRKK
jgi:hypothetical protein